MGDLPSTASHIRKHHLGHSIACPYCGARYYNASGWRDHMEAKHARLLWFSAQVNPLAPVCPAFLPDAAPGKAPTLAPPPLSTVMESSADTVVPDPEGGDEEETDPDPPTGVPISGIDRFSIEELGWFMRFPPSDLRQWNFVIGGSWMNRHKRDDSQTKLLAEELVSQDVKHGAVTEVTEKEEEEEESILSSQSQQGHPRRHYEFHEQKHYTKHWKGDSEDGAPLMG